MDATSLIGKPVFAVDAGRKLGTVERLLFSLQEKRVTAFELTPAASTLQPVLPVEKIRAIGHDAITVASEADLEATVEGSAPPGWWASTRSTRSASSPRAARTSARCRPCISMGATTASCI